MGTLTLSVIDTDTHSDTNDIICYMIVFWELNSYWCNFKTFLHGEWNEKIWTVCHVWNCLDSLLCKKIAQIVYVWMKWWNLDHYCLCVNKYEQFEHIKQIEQVFEQIFCVNRLNRFFCKVSVKFEQILLLFFLSRLNRFCVNQGCQNRDLM